MLHCTACNRPENYKCARTVILALEREDPLRSQEGHTPGLAIVRGVWAPGLVSKEQRVASDRVLGEGGTDVLQPLCGGCSSTQTDKERGTQHRRRQTTWAQLSGCAVHVVGRRGHTHISASTQHQSGTPTKSLATGCLTTTKQATVACWLPIFRGQGSPTTPASDCAAPPRFAHSANTMMTGTGTMLVG